MGLKTCVGRLPSRDSPNVVRRTEHVDPAHILSQDFSHTVSEVGKHVVSSLFQGQRQGTLGTQPKAACVFWTKRISRSEL